MLAAFVLSAALLTIVLTRITMRTDMIDFLPRGETQAARLVMDEARSGASTGLILLGIEGAAVPDLARISRSMAASLSATGLFKVVAGGEASLPREAIDTLFAHRYLLADTDFAEANLRRGMQGLLRELRTSAAPLVATYGLADPPGAMLTVLRHWAGQSQVRQVAGAWFAPDRDRALLLARTTVGGMDVTGQEQSIGAIEASFRAAEPGDAHLLVSGPAVFARDAARAIRGDVERLSIFSTLLVAILLWLRFRSPLVLLAIASPVLLSIAAAAASVQLLYGYVHGVALGFGATMLGISVDYPVLMIGHRKSGEAAPATRARIGRAYILAVTTAALGLSAMTISGFPGLVQLGAFASIGLASCAALTWFVLPRLIVAANLAPVYAGNADWLARVERLRRWRWWCAAPVAAALVCLAAIGGPRRERNLENLSPVPETSRALDRALRAELGAADPGQIVFVRGDDVQSVLQREEALAPAIERLMQRGVLTGVEDAAQLVPSAARQASRAAALPAENVLAERVASAQQGLPFRAEAFAPFLDAVQASRTMPPLLPSELASSPLGARLDPLLIERDGAWRGPVILHGVQDSALVAASLAGSGALYVDIRSELSGVLARYSVQAWRWLGASLVVMVAVLFAGLRRPTMVARVLGSVLAALLLTVSVLTLCGVRISLLHLVALPLVAGVGLDYALFFARRQLDAEERARTFRTLVTCNAMTLLTFGLLAFCQTPVLRDLGVTVGCGAALALLYAFFVTGEAPSRA